MKMIDQHHQYLAAQDSIQSHHHHHHHQQNQLHNQKLQQHSDITSRPSQQSSPTDSNSLSTSSPPHQVSRASPASTALVMSNNNLNGQPNSRQLTPNTNSTGSASNNGTGSSSNGNTGHHGGPPNPMIRQYASHTKSMSAGVVVPVPGISSNLATATGIHQNNMINHNIVNSSSHRAAQVSSQTNHHVNISNGVHQHSNSSSRAYNHHQQQQFLTGTGREHNHRNLHHHSNSQQSAPANVLSHHQQAQQQHPQPQQLHGSYHHSGQNGSSTNFISTRQPTGSSIILSSNNLNSLHNRSASTHLSNMLMGPQNHHSQSSHQVNSGSRNFPPNVTNSIWSIDENICKINGKLSASNYLPQSYLFNPSITDMSCDNVSNASRMIDGGAPTSGYYLHGHGNLNPNPVSSSISIKAPEFLPICDLMFNLISMIIYFCGNTFNVIALIALYYHAQNKYWALVGAAIVICSNFNCQYLSFKWLCKMKLEDCRRKREAREELEEEEDCERRYYNRMTANMRNNPCGSCTWLPDGATEVQLKFLLSIALDAVLHIFCLGILVRYIKLVIPVVDTTRVKREARDLCKLRMIHGFVQSASLLLLQLYIIGSQTSSTSVINLSATAAILSLLDVCWALASFTKYARKKYMHKFVLTWLGIVSQFLWRLGTVSSRVAALAIYAVYYNYWMLVILALHWFTMFLWLIKPGNLLRDEVNMSRSKRFRSALGAAWIYCFCYVNFEEHNSRAKIGLYYLVMFVENNLLFTVCQTFSSQVTWFKTISILVVYLGFVFGMLFMFLYYKYFHVTVLNNGLSCSQDSIDSIADQLSPAGKKIAGFKPGTLRLKSEDSLASGHRYNSNINATLRTGSHPEIAKNIKPPYLTNNQTALSQSGVFNCKLNTNLRKQKVLGPHDCGQNS